MDKPWSLGSLLACVAVGFVVGSVALVILSASARSLPPWWGYLVVYVSLTFSTFIFSLMRYADEQKS